jgi:PAS domain S-box-containing protein
MNDVMCIIDAQTFKYDYITGAIYELTGYTPEEMTTKTLQDIVTPESFEYILNVIKEKTEKYYAGEIEKMEATVEIQQYKKDGSLMWIDAVAKMSMLNNMPDKMIVVYRDITARKKLEEERKIAEAKILEQKEELEHQQTSLIQQTVALEQANATKDRFFSIISHDLKNPISALLTVSDTFVDFYHTMTRDQINKSIKNMRDAAYHTHKLLENLLDWSRSSMGEIVYSPMRNNIVQIINDCADYLQVQATVKNITIKVPDSTVECFVECDINLMHTVMRNLISNALKFSFAGSTVEVGVADYDDDYICVSVRDFGTGISQENIAKLFRIDEKITSVGTNKESGTGLGLILCKEFVEKHNGKIWVESEVGKGTVFSFTVGKG